MTGVIRSEHKYPAETYRLYDAQDRLLYIGVSCRVEDRLRSHSYRGAHGKAWWPEVAYCSLESFPAYHLALKAEVTAIKSERPRYNKRSAVSV